MREINFTLLLLMFIFLGLGCSKKDNRDLQEACEKAIKATEDGQYEIANNLWKELAQKYPSNSMVFYNWGTTLLGWGNCGGKDSIEHYRQAGIQLEKAANLNSKSDRIYYNLGNAYAKIVQLDPNNKTYYSQACDMYQKTTDINPNHEKAFYNWGTILSDWAHLGGSDARDKYLESYDKFQKATSIKPDKYEAFNNWGLALVNQTKIENDSKELLRQAEVVFLKSEAIKKGHSAYGLAREYALLDDEEKCKQWLKAGEEAKTLETREDAMKDEYLVSIRDKDWFKAIRWKGE